MEKIQKNYFTAKACAAKIGLVMKEVWSELWEEFKNQFDVRIFLLLIFILLALIHMLFTVPSE